MTNDKNCCGDRGEVPQAIAIGFAGGSLEGPGKEGAVAEGEMMGFLYKNLKEHFMRYCHVWTLLRMQGRLVEHSA